MEHKSAFVNIIGLPNVGKSTLLNALIGEKLSIVTPKAQTTRKRILGILNTDEYQIVFNDTPGILEPHYKMQEQMSLVIKEALQDADLILYIIEANMNEMAALAQFEKIKTKAPIFLIINKVDTVTQSILSMKLNFWSGVAGIAQVFTLSALHKTGVAFLLEKIIEQLPTGPAFYDKENISDRNVRFFVSDFIREKIFLLYKDEIPYHAEVLIEDYEEKPEIDVIKATVILNRESHKGILIGKGGAALKKLGVESRKEIEQFLHKKIFLELSIKVDENWINNEKSLKRFGY